MLIAISGSQGSGKSTVLQELDNRGYRVVQRKTSRSILSEWGVSLAEVNDDVELSKEFQAEITKRKHEDEVEALDAEGLRFTERTHADLFTYALINMGKFNDHSDWLNDYYTTSLKLQQDYTLVYYLTGGRFAIEYDGVRGSNQHYGRMVDLVMLDFTKQMTHPSKLSFIDVLNLEDRVNIILRQVEQL